MKVGFHTLGCKVNQYETEAMTEKFKDAGFEVVGDEDFADVYVINTCTVTNLADRKSRQYIRKVNRINPNSVVAVTGCYAQMSPEEVAEIPGVDIVAGTNEKANLLGYVLEHLKENRGLQLHIKGYEDLDEYHSDGIITSMETRTRAFIKIQEGCNRFCSYCIIPYARGHVRSRDIKEIVEEAKQLIKKGFKELILTGINTALYGIDTEMGGIEPLIRELSNIEGDFRIRLSSLEPTVINAEYVKLITKYEKLCPHMHLSIQSGSNRILKLMNRRYSREDYLEIVEVLKEKDPLYGITTDIIVGFPQESERDFEDSLKIVSEAGFCRIHVFKYSPRENTKAASMSGQIDGNVKNHRSELLIAEGERISKEFYERCKGHSRRVLFEDMNDEGFLNGYTDNYVKVYVKGSADLMNSFAYVTLLESYKDGMIGELTDLRK